VRPDLDAAAGDGHVCLADGRIIAFRSFGDRNGQPLLALHGTPGSRLKFSATDAAARALGLYVIAPDRWGYGATSPRPAPSLRAFADDMAALCDQLALARLGVLGVSGGGPYAAAVAAGLGKRVTALALVAPVGPIAETPAAEMGRFHRLCFGPLARSPRSAALVFGSFRRLIQASPRLAMRVAMARVPPSDRETLRSGDVAARLARTFAVGLAPGTVGPVTDLALFGAAWGVPLESISAPTRLWLGTADRNIPLAAARGLASRIPGAETVELAGEGHLWVARHYGEVIGWIASAGAARVSSPG
jgi:pimeloyl-ACP methyl ester carboxylesterase